MVKNRLAQIVYRSIYIAIGLVGLAGGMGAFSGKYLREWYLYFTNISNWLCFFVMLALLIYTIRDYKKGEKFGLVSQAPLFRFCVLVMILLTFLVANTLLSNPFSADYWTNVVLLLLHLVLPVMFIVDYLLFSEHRALGVFAPLYSMIMPLVYVAFILVRAEVKLGSGEFTYPYFFLDAFTLGYGKVFLYVAGLLVIFVALGYAVWAYDKLVKDKNTGKLKWDFSPLPKKVEDQPQVQESEVKNENIKANDEIEK